MKSLKNRPAGLFLVFCFVLSPSFLRSQSYPPAQGPPNTTVPGIPVSIFVNAVDATIRKTIESTNASISRNAESTKVKAKLTYAKQLFQPRLTVTKYENRPNQRIIRISLMIHYAVGGISWRSLPYPGRKLGQTIDIDISCKDWFTGNGFLNVYTKIGSIFLDGNSFKEEALNFFIAHTLTSLIDNELRKRLPEVPNQVINLTSQKCDRLGLDPGIPPEYGFADVRFSRKPATFQPQPPVASRDIRIVLQSLRRLVAKDASGQTLYNPEENIQLEFYANQVSTAVTVNKIREGEERALDAKPISFTKPPTSESLVLIANIQQLPGLTAEDSRFVVFPGRSNFGNGIRTLRIQKSYWTKPLRLPGGGTSKPAKMKVDAYELRFQVIVPSVVIGH